MSIDKSWLFSNNEYEIKLKIKYISYASGAQPKLSLFI